MQMTVESLIRLVITGTELTSDAWEASVQTPDFIFTQRYCVYLVTAELFKNLYISDYLSSNFFSPLQPL